MQYNTAFFPRRAESVLQACSGQVPAHVLEHAYIMFGVSSHVSADTSVAAMPCI